MFKKQILDIPKQLKINSGTMKKPKLVEKGAGEYIKDFYPPFFGFGFRGFRFLWPQTTSYTEGKKPNLSIKLRVRFLFFDIFTAPLKSYSFLGA